MRIPAISIHCLTKYYGAFKAVDNISFDVQEGDFISFLGPNGAGKTTTLEIIECLKRQTSGNCRVLGLDNLKQPQEIKKKIGVQLQHSEYLNNLNLSELLILFASLYGNRINPLKVLDRVGLEHKAKSAVKELSGGQKQRFTIASALVHTPEILFMDEPTTGLDPHVRREIWQLIKELNNASMTIVMTTHYMEEAEYLCDRVAIMDNGKILKLDQPKKLIEDLGEGYTLSFFSNQEIDKFIFSSIEGVTEIHFEYPKVIIGLKGIESLPEIINALRRNNIKYSFLNVESANLEDVYLHLTGHEYEI